MKFARIVFLAGGIWGVLALTPLYFMRDTIGAEAPPPVTHPEFYYGFVGVALAWQLAFLLIAADPPRFKPLMAVAVIEKFSFVITIAALYLLGQVGPGRMMLGAAADLVLGTLFLAALLSAGPLAARR